MNAAASAAASAAANAAQQDSLFWPCLTDASVRGLKRLLPGTRSLAAFGEALFPQGTALGKPPEHLPEKVNQLLAEAGVPPWLFGGLLLWLEARSLATTGRTYSSLPLKQRIAMLDRWVGTPVGGGMLRMLAMPFKAAYLTDDGVLARANAPRCVETIRPAPKPRWRHQAVAATACDEDIVLEADVVVLGSGAGGAMAAYELARQGHAVVIVEQGRYYDRHEFNGNVLEMIGKLYRNPIGSTSIGNNLILLPVGESVGGTTTVNSGTCVRAPNDVMERWRQGGLNELGNEELLGIFDEVENLLHVEEAERKQVGPVCDLIEKGAQALGFHETSLLKRNAIACDGQGLCQFGCPTDAKQSTNVSLIPGALKRGAMLYSEFRADRLLWSGRDCRGIRAIGHNADGRRVTLKVHAKHTIVSMGSLSTPLFLRQNGVQSAWLGRNLSIHPTGLVAAHFPGQKFDNQGVIPQGFALSDLQAEGILFEGATPPLLVYGIYSQVLGSSFMHLMERYQNSAFFGFLLRDESRGNVRPGISDGIPLITYNMKQRDFSRYLRAMTTLARIFFAAGAEEVYFPTCAKQPILKSELDVDDFMRRRWRPRDFIVSAYHPLGTARIGADPQSAVCDANHRVFGHRGLYVMDGSSVPSSLGVNPMMTIMALAMRASRRLAQIIDSN